MNRLTGQVIPIALLQVASFAQTGAVQIEGKEVFKNDDVVFHQIDEHTWVGFEGIYGQRESVSRGRKRQSCVD